MKTNTKFTIFLLTLLFLWAGTSFSQVTDKDGNVYKTVKIGLQEWSAENLNVSHYRNGDEIPHVQDAIEWSRLTTGAWCWYEDSTENGKIYGKLYNWYALNDPRGLAPDGWHISTDNDWQQLVGFLGDWMTSGQKLKGKSGWFKDRNGTDESGFNAVPGGIRDSDGDFYDYLKFGCFWTSTENTEENAWYYFVIHSYTDVARFDGAKKRGLSIRLVKD